MTSETKAPSKETSTPTRKTVHVAIILDRSGSMDSCRDATISGFNEYVDTLDKGARDTGLRTKVSLAVFNQETVTPLFRAPLERLHRLDRRSYVPGGNTAMLDAVGMTLDRLVMEVRKPQEKAFVVCIMSDGYENASRNYTYADIAERIGRLTAEGNWTFTYLGSNQDLGQVADQMHIPRGNMASYSPTPEGTDRAWRRHGTQTLQRMQDINQGVAGSSSFYGSDEVADIAEEK